MITTRQNGSLYTNIQNHVATIEFGHPASNSLPIELLKRLSNEILLIGNNAEVFVIVLKSEGEKTFCAGASFTELIALNNLQNSKAFFLGFANVINAIRTCSALVIGSVQGKTVGGGVGLAAACDYVLATEQAAIKLSELSIGIGPFVIEPAVTRKIGVAAMAELTLNPTEWKSAYWAQEKGLFAKVLENKKELDNQVAFLANNLASYNPNALTEMKKTLWQGTGHWNKLLEEKAAISGRLVLSEFTKKALNKFKK